ncbi:hypothetical protein K458DRAFT_387118 [Lentithecium fluviatile CBS 122367]|uniref:DNA recombination and repair protein Rad51-like C-terminal domain-containing protein n=1 Tax=Lentithecium fluviatile CBS 122367 TaxID=1168545 RepID=A0A6G1J7A0_9PLEO|nr:hypothetical protein K458DRAFT_387118 [Lentithecium fluviatile CBS 122367]
MDGGGASAKKLGERLLGDVAVEGLASILASLRKLALPDGARKVFGIPELDVLLLQPAPVQPPPRQITAAAQNQRQHENDDLWTPNAPSHQQHQPVQPPAPTIARQAQHPSTHQHPHILELISPPPTHHPSPAGKTSLLYHLTTHAILPSHLGTILISGLNSAVVILDPLSHFHIPRLAQIMLCHISRHLRTADRDISDEGVRIEVLECVKRSLQHVHIFRPTCWEGLLATLSSLPSYLFDGPRHRSMNRPIHALILEDMHIFTPHIRSLSTSTTSPHTATPNPNPLTTPSIHLTTHLTHLSTHLSTNIILTSHSTSPGAFRPPLPTAWPPALQARVTRLTVRRVEVVKFAPGMCVEEAEGERRKRWDIVERGRFEVWRVRPGAGPGGGGKEKGKEGEGFVFRVGGGVEIEREEGL